MTFWERLSDLMEEKSISQKELAEIAGVHSTAITGWKNEGSIPRADVAVKVARHLGTSVEFLVTGEESGTSEKELNELKKKFRAIQDLISSSGISD